ncbi:MAG: FAD-binding oxidoreductase [Rhodobacterales bacterium]|nr:FAD-binding oxidoreductase [Rhodobacterales bacterium]
MALKPADDTFVDRLRAVLPDRAVRPVQARYLEEPRGRWQGQAAVIVAPETVDEVAQVMTLANQARVAVVPYGGGTGLVGGQVMAKPQPVPIVLSLERMTKIRALYPDENVMIVEAGAILADVRAAAETVDRLFPLSIASQGSARIGGNLATNAGGVNVLRYGNARDLCLGLEVVLPDGRIWNGLTRLRKDNTGYDVRNLMIGSEGTLGVITAAALKLFPRPAVTGVALMTVTGPEAALALLGMARDQIGEAVSAFELIHAQGLRFLQEVGPQVRQPFKNIPEWMVLIEVGLAQGQDADGALGALFEAAVTAGAAQDGVIAQSQSQADAFWNIRESIPEANRRVGSLSSHDISVPLGEIAGFITRAGVAVARLGGFRINCFGHLGDGNLHYNVFPVEGRQRTDYPTELRAKIAQVVHDLVAETGGSFSAEHGVGRLKAKDLMRYGDPVKIAMMQGVKSVFDPNGIMNPGAVIGET